MLFSLKTARSIIDPQGQAARGEFDISVFEESLKLSRTQKHSDACASLRQTGRATRYEDLAAQLGFKNPYDEKYRLQINHLGVLHIILSIADMRSAIAVLKPAELKMCGYSWFQNGWTGGMIEFAVQGNIMIGCDTMADRGWIHHANPGANTVLGELPYERFVAPADGTTFVSFSTPQILRRLA